MHSKPDNTIVGSARIAADELRLKLGEPSFYLWARLCLARNPQDGTTTLSEAQLAGARGHEELSRAHAHKCLVRLERAGLLEKVGRRTVQERVGALVVARSATVRRVFGEPPISRHDQTACVPEATKQWVRSAASWGGRRAGAGRPKSESSTPMHDRNPEAENRGDLASDPNSRVSNLLPSFARASDPDPDLDHALVQSIDSPFGGFNTTRGRGSELNRLCYGSAELGSVLGDSAPRRTLHPATLGLAHPGVPGPVSVQGTVGVRVPSAPLLRADDSPERRAYLLSRWYVGAIESKTGKRCFAFNRGPIARSKHYSALVAVAEVFIAEEIAPAAWCAFSVSVWREHDTKNLPPVRWVFALDRIRERKEWFFSEAEDWNSGRLFLTTSGTTLLRKQAAMRAALAQVSENDLEHTKAIVRRFFGLGEFEALLEAAKREARDAELDIRSRVSAGEWVW